MPNTVEGGNPFVYSDDLIGVWKLKYPDASINLKRVGPDVTKVDWAFIIAYVLSLIALLFTFDSISGERESGTLRLTLANSVPRHAILLGKFLGALISISIPFMLAMLMNLLIISTSSAVHLNAEAWGTFRYYLLYCPPIHVSISCVRTISLSARTTECREPSDTPIDLGHLRCFYAKHLGFNRKRVCSLNAR